MSLFDAFTSWNLTDEDIQKARKPIGLENWKRLAHMAGQLKGKKAADLTFTTCYPGQEGKKKTLGSVEGNLHFLLGYANPGFHLAPYHWMVVDPNLSETDALMLHKTKGHPSRPELWECADLETTDEGDLIEGHPHPSVGDVREAQRIIAAKTAESITVQSGAGTYTGIPSEGLLYGRHNDHVYAWEMVKDSFFAASNQELADKMNEALDAHHDLYESVNKADIEPDIKPVIIPEQIKHLAALHAGNAFNSEVYPLVKSHFPVPGTVIPADTEKGNMVYGIVTKSSIDFYDREGCPVNVEVYDLPFTTFDLSQDGDIYASVIKSFGVKYLGIPSDLEEFVDD